MVEASCALPVRETSKSSMQNPNLLALAVLAGTFAACDSEGAAVPGDHEVNGALVAAEHQLQQVGYEQLDAIVKSYRGKGLLINVWSST